MLIQLIQPISERERDPEDNKKLYRAKGVIVGVYYDATQPSFLVYISARRFCINCILVKPHPAV